MNRLFVNTHLNTYLENEQTFCQHSLGDLLQKMNRLFVNTHPNTYLENEQTQLKEKKGVKQSKKIDSGL